MGLGPIGQTPLKTPKARRSGCRCGPQGTCKPTGGRFFAPGTLAQGRNGGCGVFVLLGFTLIFAKVFYIGTYSFSTVVELRHVAKQSGMAPRHRLEDRPASLTPL